MLIVVVNKDTELLKTVNFSNTITLRGVSPCSVTINYINQNH
jgi:hypothetical protein